MPYPLVEHSQFEDIYQEEHFMQTLKDEVNIVKDLPLHLKLLDLETAGSIVSEFSFKKYDFNFMVSSLQ